MTVTIDNKQYKLWFEHGKRGTLAGCCVDDATFSAQSHLSRHDNYSKSIGRRKSLDRLMRRAEIPVLFTREMRTVVWREYFRVHADLTPKVQSETLREVLTRMHGTLRQDVEAVAQGRTL